MKHAWLAAALAAMLIAGCQGAADRTALRQCLLPQGDPGAGRQAFITLRCTGCHRVSGDPELPAPVAAEGGPVLGDRATIHTPGSLATAIVAPSHTIAPGGAAWREGELSRMGEYASIMTIQQLADLVSYLEEPGGERQRYRAEMARPAPPY